MTIGINGRGPIVNDIAKECRFYLNTNLGWRIVGGNNTVIDYTAFVIDGNGNRNDCQYVDGSAVGLTDNGIPTRFPTDADGTNGSTWTMFLMFPNESITDDRLGTYNVTFTPNMGVTISMNGYGSIVSQNNAAGTATIEINSKSGVNGIHFTFTGYNGVARTMPPTPLYFRAFKNTVTDTTKLVMADYIAALAPFAGGYFRNMEGLRINRAATIGVTYKTNATALLDNESLTWDLAFMGQPVEVIMEVAERANMVPWVNLYDLLADSAITAVAQRCKAKLPVGRDIAFEYSNEVWQTANAGFIQASTVYRRAMGYFDSGGTYQAQPGDTVRVNKWAFSEGGTYQPLVGDTVTGATSGATASIVAISLSGGSYAANTATGTVFFGVVTGTFLKDEQLTVNGNASTLKLGTDSSAVGVIGSIILSSGSWAAGTAAGQFLFSSSTGNFSNGDEMIINNNVNAATNRTIDLSLQYAREAKPKFDLVDAVFVGETSRVRPILAWQTETNKPRWKAMLEEQNLYLRVKGCAHAPYVSGGVGGYDLGNFNVLNGITLAERNLVLTDPEAFKAACFTHLSGVAYDAAKQIHYSFVNTIREIEREKGLPVGTIRKCTYEHAPQHIIEKNTPTASNQHLLTRQAFAEMDRDGRMGTLAARQLRDYHDGGDIDLCIFDFSGRVTAGAMVFGSWSIMDSVTETTDEPYASIAAYLTQPKPVAARSSAFARK